MNRPLAGLAFCCTSIPARLREQLAQKITSMGGIHYSDLMSDVNYLIVGDRKTEKYNYCIKYRHDVKFIRSDAILKIHELWLAGEEDATILSIDNYTMPLFDGLIICMSRIEIDGLQKMLQEESFRSRAIHSEPVLTFPIDDIYSSKRLANIIELNGGRITELLTVSNSCVISTEKKGKRYTKALEWAIPVVHPIWIWDSIIRNASLKLDDYQLGTSISYNIGCKVWDKFLDELDDNVATNDVQDIEDLRSKDSTAILKKLETNTNIWDSIMTNGSTKISNVNKKKSLWADNEEDDEEDDEGVENENDNEIDNINDTGKEMVGSRNSAMNKIFTGSVFFISEFDDLQRKILHRIIGRNGGTVVTNEYSTTLSLVLHLLVPVKRYNNDQNNWESFPRKIKELVKLQKIQVVTEWFIERSIFYEKVTLDQWGKPPVPIDMNIGVSSIPNSLSLLLQLLKISVTGFTGVELLHLQKLISYTNNEFHETLSSKRNLLIVNINLFENAVKKKSPQLLDHNYKGILDCPVYKGEVTIFSSKNKINAAKNWNIPIVTIAYLWELMKYIYTGSTSLPTISDPRWCIFSKDLKNDPEPEPEPTNSNSPEPFTGIPQLPSPRKSKKQSYGRIVGRSPTKVRGRTSFLHSDGPDVTLDEDIPTVGYESEQIELNQPSKRRRTRSKQ